ncbi:hypothetical protein ACPXB3_19765 [Gordonia sp. DT219]|uniref:hypothetical protein n=1 Tax=Gordonia sp. DT219 TaxID=3416658 RepID=UPI003CEB2B08
MTAPIGGSGPQPYGQPPVYGQQHPGYGPNVYGQNPFGAQPQRQAAPGTAYATAALAILGALYMLLDLGLVVVWNASHHFEVLRYGSPAQALALILLVIMLGLLGAGGVLVLVRRPAGRILVVVGAGLYVLQFLGWCVYWMVAYGVPGPDSIMVTQGLIMGTQGLPHVPNLGVLDLLLLVFPIVTAVLALLPSTSRWLRARPQRGPVPSGPPRW